MALILGVAASACAPEPAAAPTPAGDPFAVVRATAQAAYQEGQGLVQRGDVVGGCTLIDRAATNDPDSRTDVQQALEQCKVALSAMLAAQLTPTAASTSAAGATQRPLVVPTVPAFATQAAAGATQVAAVATQLAPAVATPAAAGAPQAAAAATQGAAAVATQVAAARVAAAGSPVVATPPTPAASAALQTWNDPQARFSVAAPPDWNRVDQPQALFGTAAVEFHDTSGRASLGVAVDSQGRAVSPELYAASMELNMQQQVPGYALEQVVPGSTAGNPSIRRTFTFTQKDASGRDLNVRAFQVTVLKGSTPYIITAYAPADQFAQFSPVFDQIVDSFRFS